jgi:FAD/FMN-containing dehydrogenase
MNTRHLSLQSGWGNYPKLQAHVIQPASPQALAALCQNPQPLIARGMGRSYGDSALADTLLSTQTLNHYLDFAATLGLLTCSAGDT